MSQVRVDFIGDYSDLKRKTERAEAQLERMRRKVKRESAMMNQAFKKIGAGLSLFALVNGLQRAGEAAAADAKSQRLLELQLRTTTKASDKQIASNESFIQTLSNQVGIVDDELRPAFAKLLRGTGKVEKAQKLLKIVLDGAAASGKSVATVSDAITKANNGNLTSLYRLAPQLKKTKGGIDEYAKSVKGAAQASADPYSKLSVVLDNLNEQVGTALLPAFQGLANYLIENGPAISKFLKDLFDPKTKIGAAFQKFGEQLADLFNKVDMFFANFDPDGKSGIVGFFTILSVLLETVLGTIDNIVKAYQYLISNQEQINAINGGSSIADIPIANTNDIGRQQRFGRQSYMNLNFYKANVNPADVVKEIKKYERETGKAYLR